MRSICTLGSVVFFLVLVGCESPDQGRKTSGNLTSKEVQEKAAAAVKAFADFAKQENDSFRKQMEAQLAELDENIRKLNARLAEAGAEASQDLKEIVDEMGKQSKATRQKLVELGSATSESVGALRDTINNRVGDLKESYEKADSATK